MFEGNTLKSYESPEILLFCIALTIIGLVVWIRHGFLKECRLANYLIFNINRIWKRGADEVPQAEGIMINHVCGILSLTTIGWFEIPYYISFVIAVAIVFAKRIMFWVMSLIPKIYQLGNEHNIIDRLCRFWMSAGVGLVALILAMLPKTQIFHSYISFGCVWGISILFRWIRVFQSANRRLNSINYSFLYLCALEIFPVLAFVKLISVSTKWI
tara:strand:- start:1159 stop:1800 length:642 start_codon:yes stop_codon:yes gene_type:complete